MKLNLGCGAAPGEITALARERNNVVAECRIQMGVRKPAG